MNYNDRGASTDLWPGAQAPTGPSRRKQYRKVRARRKALVFGTGTLGLLLALSAGVLSATGHLELPLASDFSHKVHYAKVGEVPCPTEGARPTPAEGQKVSVYNTTSTPGLAGKAADYLEAQGFTIETTGNAPLFRGEVLIEAGPRGVDAAYTLARYFTDPRIKLNLSEDDSVNIFLGEKFAGMPTPERTEEINEDRFALIPLSGCLPVREPENGWDIPQSQQSGAQSADSPEDSEDTTEE